MIMCMYVCVVRMYVCSVYVCTYVCDVRTYIHTYLAHPTYIQLLNLAIPVLQKTLFLGHLVQERGVSGFECYVLGSVALRQFLQLTA